MENKIKEKKKNKLLTGFTIIELLVVIAIIAVLAAIVLVNVTQYIAKGKDAAIKGNMATILTNMAVYNDKQNPSTYAGFTIDCTPASLDGDSTFKGPATAIKNAGGTTSCLPSTAGAACVRTTLNGGAPDYCVDSTGYKGAPTGATDCAVGGDSTCQ